MPTGRTHRCLRTVHYFCRRLTSLIRYSYLSLSLRLSEEMIRLKSYVVCPSDIFPANAHTFAKMLFPLDKNIALIDGNFMSFCRQQRQALFDCQLSHERARFSLLKSINGRFRNAFACDWGWTPTSGLNFPRFEVVAFELLNFFWTVDFELDRALQFF